MIDRQGTPHVGPSVGSRPYQALERHILITLSRKDHKHYPPLWLWRMLPMDSPGGVVPDEALWESPRILRKYADPIPAHIFIDPKKLAKSHTTGVVSTSGGLTVGISRAEARRLGEVYGLNSDAENRVGLSEGEFLYVPRPGDIFRYSDDHYMIQQWDPPARFGNTTIITHWNGLATCVHEDTTAAGFNFPTPPTPQPPMSVNLRRSWRG